MVPCEAELDAVEQAVLRMTMRRRRLVRAPASSANLGPGFDALAAALQMHMELEVEETGDVRRAHRPRRPARPQRTCACARSSTCTTPARSSSRSAPPIPLTGGLGSSAAAIVAGLMAADHLFELDADLLAAAIELEGHPDNVAATLLGGFVVCADGQRHPLRHPRRAGGRGGGPRRDRCATADARAALPDQVPLADAVFNVAHASLLVLGLARGEWDLVARGLDDRLHQPRRAHLYPRSLELADRARGAGGAGRDDLRRRARAAGVDPLRADRRAWWRACAASVADGRDACCESRSRPQGAEVREL